MFEERLVQGVGIGFTSLGLIAVVIHSILAFIETPILYNQYPCIWLGGLLAFSGLQLIYFSKNGGPTYSNLPTRLLLLAYQMLHIIASGVVTVSYAIAGYFAVYLAALLLVANVFSMVYLVPSSRATGKVDEGCARKYGLKIGHALIRFAFLFFIGVLADGSIITVISQRYSPRGIRYPITLTDGRKTSLHVLCTGPATTNLSSIWLLSSPAHGVVDYYGVQQRVVNNSSRRFCTMDMPGFGWSDDLMAKELDPALYMGPIVDASNEISISGNNKLIIIAHGGGATPAIRLIETRPELVKALIFFTVWPDGVESDYVTYRQNVSQEEGDRLRRIDFEGRIALTRLILGVLGPWGWIPIFLPVGGVATTYEPQDRVVEFRVQLWRYNVWINQYWALQDAISNYSRNTSVTPSIQNSFLNNAYIPAPLFPFAHITCNKTADQICNPQVNNSTTSKQLTGDACTEALVSYEYYRERLVNLTTRIYPDGSPLFVYIGDDDCGLATAIEQPISASDAILRAIQTLGV